MKNEEAFPSSEAASARRQVTTELSDSRPAVVTPVTLDHQSAPPKSTSLERRSGAAVRSSDLVSPSFHVVSF